jgi:phage terminase small subunit
MTLENMEVQMETRAAPDRATLPATVLPGRALTPRQSTFADLYAATGAIVDSYKAAYGCEGSSLATVRVNASRLLSHPKVAARIRELQEAAGALTLRSTQDLVADLEAVAYADIGELMAVWNGCCRRCWGTGGAYQWASGDAYALAAEAAVAKGEPVPGCEGGFGFDAGREPNPDCEHCNGLGVARVRYNSTALASPAARRLVRGIETWPDGTLKRLHVADQTAMRAELHKLRGLHVDRSLSLNLHATIPAPKDITTEQALAAAERALSGNRL